MQQQDYHDQPLTADEVKTAGYTDRPLTWPDAHPQLAAAARGALKTLPVMGAVLGGLAGSGAMTIPGAALGAGLGKGAQDVLEQATGLQDTTPQEKARAIASAVQWTAGGALAGKAAGDAAPLVNRALQKVANLDPDIANAVNPKWAARLRLAQRAMKANAPSAEPTDILPTAVPVETGMPVGPRPVIPSPQMIRNQLGLAARRTGVTLTPDLEATATDLMRKGSPATDALAQAASSAKPVLSAGEVKLMQAMRQQGATDEQITQAIQQARAFNARFGLGTPTADEMRFPKGMRGAPRYSK